MKPLINISKHNTGNMSPITTKMDDEWNVASGQSFRPFGPPIYIGGINPIYIDEMNEHISNDVEKKDVAGQLAGRVKDQLLLEHLVSNNCKKHIKQHVLSYAESNNLGMEDYHITMDGLWVNKAVANDFNPRHSHDGCFSFVIFTKNTVDSMDAINNPYDKSHGEAMGLAGNLELSYGEYNFMSNCRYLHEPRVGDILVFPSWVQHSVFPFYCDGERWSVAGNFRFATEQEIQNPLDE